MNKIILEELITLAIRAFRFCRVAFNKHTLSEQASKIKYIIQIKYCLEKPHKNPIVNKPKIIAEIRFYILEMALSAKQNSALSMYSATARKTINILI